MPICYSSMNRWVILEDNKSLLLTYIAEVTPFQLSLQHTGKQKSKGCKETELSMYLALPKGMAAYSYPDSRRPSCQSYIWVIPSQHSRLSGARSSAFLSSTIRDKSARFSIVSLRHIPCIQLSSSLRYAIKGQIPGPTGMDHQPLTLTVVRSHLSRKSLPLTPLLVNPIFNP